MSTHSLRPSIYLLSPSKLAFHNSAAWEIVFRIKSVTVVNFYIAISYAIWVSRSLDSHFNIHTSNIVNWYRNRTSKTTSSYILLFEHGRRLNSTVSNHANNRKFGRMLRWFWQCLFHMEYEHERVELTYQYSNSKHIPLTSESISKNRIIVHLDVRTMQAMELQSIKSC